MTNLTQTYFDLIDLIEQQSNVITKQADTITKLLNDNAEQENMIKELLN